ncbi:MAG: hypothetical protein GX490_04425, partial [Bacilli bacterium]|nr:hypothetical protein [Bacilli bacterium]
MISYANEMIYFLFGVWGLFFYLDNRNPLILILLIIYSIYILRYRLKVVFIIALVCLSYFISYKLQLKEMSKYDKEVVITCTVVTLPEYKENYT